VDITAQMTEETLLSTLEVADTTNHIVLIEDIDQEVDEINSYCKYVTYNM